MLENSRRRTGKSFRIALEVLALASRNPGQKIMIHDHHPTHMANVFLAETIKRLIYASGIEGFKVGRFGIHNYVIFEEQND